MNDTTDKSFEPSAKTVLSAPDTTVDVRETFGIDIDWQVPAFSQPDKRTPDRDESYVFEADTTMAILAGFAHDRRVMAITARASRLTSNRSPRASTGRASASISMRISAAST